MNFKPILIVSGEPNSVFLEIFFKSIKQKKYKRPLVLIGSKNILNSQMNKLNYNYKVNILDQKNIFKQKLNNRKINLIDVKYKQKKPFEKISYKSRKYIEDCFDISLDLLNKNVSDCLINGPISKKFFLGKKDFGITEYLARKTSTKSYAMLIFNKKLSVTPLTTHIPIKLVSKQILKKRIIEKILIINDFYKERFKFKPRIGVTGLNPHCESKLKFNEDEIIIKPSVKILKKKNINVRGPYAADTLFLKNNRDKFDVIVGMFHDQVLTPAKTLFEYDAINITLGLPFIRISPDHGPNEKMLGKNLSSPLSLIKALKFLDKS